MGQVGTVDDDEGVIFQVSGSGLKKKKPKLRWNRFKWVLFLANSVVSALGLWEIGIMAEIDSSFSFTVWRLLSVPSLSGSTSFTNPTSFALVIAPNSSVRLTLFGS